MSEAAMLQGVRDAIRVKLKYKAGECDVEIDEFPPAACGEVYIAVQPQLWTAGPNNATSGGVLDELFACKVSVIVRGARVPSDKRRTLLLENLIGLNDRLRAIIDILNHRQDVIAMVNGYLAKGQEPFIKPMIFDSCDSVPRVVGGETFKAGAMPQAGLVRAAIFKTRRVQTQTIQQ